jgi:hypothetical protein
MAISDFLSSPMGLASLSMAQGMSTGDALMQGRKEAALIQNQQLAQQKQQRMAQVEQRLPELMAQIDINKPMEAMGMLLNAGAPLDVAQKLLTSVQQAAQQQSINTQRNAMQDAIANMHGGGMAPQQQDFGQGELEQDIMQGGGIQDTTQPQTMQAPQPSTKLQKAQQAEKIAALAASGGDSATAKVYGDMAKRMYDAIQTEREYTQPKPEAGRRYNEEGELEPIVGSKAWTEAEEKKGEAEAQNLADRENALYLLSNIDNVLSHEGLDEVVGLKGPSAKGWGILPFMDDEPIGGTDAAGFTEALGQIKGKVFMEAYKDLKGGGQITEIEGAKAEAAKARLGTAQSEVEFKKALTEFRGVIDRGLRRSRGEDVTPLEIELLDKNALRELLADPQGGAREFEDAFGILAETAIKYAPRVLNNGQ